MDLPRRRRRTHGFDMSMAIVNVVLLLLFFFLVIGPQVQPRGGLTLARTVDLPLDRLPSPVLVILPDGGWSLDGVAIAPELLRGSMAGKGDTLHVLIDREDRAATLIALLRSPETTGFRVRLVTLRGASP
ncbi:MAG: hypothetical protein Q4G49_05515 [Paracoccus sp. (in: a-proteobacteria)]|nr:hypothetical protein [Paracoccus sp. (in: a-proteobacteria)]